MMAPARPQPSAAGVARSSRTDAVFDAGRAPAVAAASASAAAAAAAAALGPG